MSSVNLGLVTFDVWPVILVISIVIGSIVTLITAKKHKGRGTSALLVFLLTGLVIGRLVFVIRFFDGFDSFWQVLDIRDGGIDYTAVLIACTVVMLLQIKKYQQRKAMFSGVFTMLGTYTAFSFLVAVASSHAVLPDRDFMALDGQALKITDIRKQQPVIMNLWASSCAPCRREMPVLVQAEQEYDELTFISLNQRESAERAQRFLQKEGLDFQHVLLDLKGEVAQTKGIFSLPVTLFFDEDGQLTYSHSGELSAERLREIIEQYL